MSLFLPRIHKFVATSVQKVFAEKLDGKIVCRYFGIKTLPRQFDPLKPVLMNMHDKPFEDVCQLIIDYERSNFQDVLAVQIRTKAQEFHKRSRQNGNAARQPSNTQSGPNDQKRPQCSYCPNFGHLKVDCRKLARSLQKAAPAHVDKKPEQKSTQQPPRQPSEQMNSFGWIGCITDIRPIDSSPAPTPTHTCPTPDLIFENELDEFNKIDEAKVYTNESDHVATSPRPLQSISVHIPVESSPQFACATGETFGITPSAHRDEDLWFLDSGATQSATNCKSNLNQLEPCQLRMGSATGQDLNIQAVGNVVIATNQNIPIFLTKCYFSPDLIGNFISISKLTDQKFTITFERYVCYIYKNGVLVAEGFRANDLYAIKAFTLDRLCAVSNTPLPEQTPEELAMSWHRALNYINFSDLFKLKHQLGLKPCNIRLQCEVCQLAKCHKQPFSISKTISVGPLDLIHSDVSGIVRQPSHSLCKYFLTFIDDYSRYTHLYPLKSRTEVLEKFIEYKSLVETHLDRKIKTFRTDNGTEYTSNAFDGLLKKYGIHHEYTHIHSPQENGVSERLNRTLEEGARAALIDSKLSTYYWLFAVQYAMHVKNRLPHSAVHFKIPFELWFKKSVNFSMFRPFGCAVVAYDPEPTGKYQQTGIPGRFLGYSLERKGFLILRNDHKAVLPSRHVTVMLQNEFCYTPSQNNIDEINDLFWDSDPEAPLDPTDLNPSIQLYDPQPDDSHVAADEPDEASPLSDDNSPNRDDSTEDFDHEEPTTPLPPNSEPGIEPNVIGHDTQFVFLTKRELEQYRLDHPQSTIVQTAGFKKKPSGGVGRPAHAYRYMINCLTQPDDVRSALSGPEGENWKSAMRDEYNSLIQNGTWTLVQRPEGVKPVQCRWVKKKYDDGEMKYKARLVAKGFSQRQGVDYFDTFSPVIRISSVRLLLSYAITNNLHAHHIDVKTAFLNGELKEDVYMSQPPLFADDDQPNLICKLQRSIYGLKQSAKCWKDTLNEILISFKLIQIKSDPCIFTAPNRSLIIGVYVDDMLVISTKINIIEEFQLQLSRRLNITYKGPARHFLGIELEHVDGRLHLSQRRQIDQMLDEHEMTDCNGVATPMVPGTTLNVEPDRHQLPDSLSYRSIVGSLLHLANFSRPDICFSVGQLCRFMASPQEAHMVAAKRVLRYLQRTKSAVLVYSPDIGETCIYNDADFNNSEDSRSTSGVCTFHLGNLVN